MSAGDESSLAEDLIDRMRESSPGFSGRIGDADPQGEEATSSKVAWLTAAEVPTGFIMVAKEALELEEHGQNFEMRWTTPIATSGLPLVMSDGDLVVDLPELHLTYQSDKAAGAVQQEFCRKRKAPDRFVVCGGEEQKNEIRKRSRKVVAANNKAPLVGKKTGIKHKSRTASSDRPPIMLVRLFLFDIAGRARICNLRLTCRCFLARSMSTSHLSKVCRRRRKLSSVST